MDVPRGQTKTATSSALLNFVNGIIWVQMTLCWIHTSSFWPLGIIQARQFKISSNQYMYYDFLWVFSLFFLHLNPFRLTLCYVLDVIVQDRDLEYLFRDLRIHQHLLNKTYLLQTCVILSNYKIIQHLQHNLNLYEQMKIGVVGWNFTPSSFGSFL